MRLGLLLWVALAALHAQQVADTQFRPAIGKPAYAAGKGPVVLIDEAHFNFHTASGRYLPFAGLLGRDGFVVRPSSSRFTHGALQPATILVISNALNDKNHSDWGPPHPSAFTTEEIAAVRDWVTNGGSLLLIADHAPFAGATQELGKAFGVRFLNGYAILPDSPGVMVFRKPDGTLKDHAITTGIDEVATFTGSAFELEREGQPLLVFSPGVILATVPKNPTGPSVGGRLQGAALPFGKGRVAVFGEAAMFSAQTFGPAKRPMGMNHPAAKQNARFLLNVMHWLAGLP
jgi:hypothetical protein